MKVSSLTSVCLNTSWNFLFHLANFFFVCHKIDFSFEKKKYFSIHNNSCSDRKISIAIVKVPYYRIHRKSVQYIYFAEYKICFRDTLLPCAKYMFTHGYSFCYSFLSLILITIFLYCPRLLIISKNL